MATVCPGCSSEGEKIASLLARKRELEDKIKAEPENKALALELEICLEDIISARASAKPKAASRGSASLSSSGEERAAFQLWIENGSEDNREELETLRLAYGRIQSAAGTEYQRKLLAMHREGKSAVEIARELGLAPSSVSRTLNRAKGHERELAARYLEAKELLDAGEIVRGKLAIYTEKQEKYLKMFRSGMTMTQIAKVCGVNHSTVSMSIGRALNREAKMMNVIGGDGKLRLNMENPEHFGAVMYAMTPRQQAAVYLRLGERQSRERCALLLHTSPGNIDRLVRAGLARAAERLSAWDITLDCADGMVDQLERSLEGIFEEPEPVKAEKSEGLGKGKSHSVRKAPPPKPEVKLTLNYTDGRAPGNPGMPHPLSRFASRLFAAKSLKAIYDRLLRWWMERQGRKTK